MHWALVAYVAIELVALLFCIFCMVFSTLFIAFSSVGPAPSMFSSIPPWVYPVVSLFGMLGVVLDLFVPSHASILRLMLAFPYASVAITIPFSAANGW